MLLAECDTEVVLAETLTSPSRKKIKHPSGKSKIIRDLMKTHTNAAGIIDEDPGKPQPPDMVRFILQGQSQTNHIKTFHHNQRRNRLVVLCPRCEEWIIAASQESNLDIRSYNLPSNPSELHWIVTYRINRFKQLVEDLVKMGNVRVKALQALLASSDC